MKSKEPHGIGKTTGGGKDKESLSVAALVKQYKQVEWADPSDKESTVSEDYIKKAVHCWNIALHIPEVLAIVRWMQGWLALKFYIQKQIRIA